MSKENHDGPLWYSAEVVKSEPLRQVGHFFFDAREPTGSNHQLAKQELKLAVQEKESLGCVFVQARAEGIDYRALMQGAIDLDEKSLEALFSMNFMGEAGETHCDILTNLMRLWGDDQFSLVLARQPENIRDLAVSSIDYGGVDWNIFPKTPATSPTSASK